MLRNKSYLAVIFIIVYFLISACGGSKYPPIEHSINSPKTLFGKNFYFYTGVEKNPLNLLGKRACKVLSDKKCRITNDQGACVFDNQSSEPNESLDSNSIYPKILDGSKRRGAEVLVYERLDPNDPPDIDNDGKAIKWCNSGQTELPAENQNDLRSVVAKVDDSREICMPIHGYSYIWVMTFDSLTKMTGDVRIALGLLGLSGGVSANYHNTAKMKILITAFFREKRTLKDEKDINETKTKDDVIDSVYVGHMNVHVFEGREDAKNMDIAFSSGPSTSILAKFSDATRFTEVHRTTYFAGVIGYSIADNSEAKVIGDYYCNKGFRLADNAILKRSSDEKISCSDLLDDISGAISCKQDYHALLSNIKNVNKDHNNSCLVEGKTASSCYKTCQIMKKTQLILEEEGYCNDYDFNKVYDFYTITVGLNDDDVCGKELAKEK